MWPTFLQILRVSSVFSKEEYEERGRKVSSLQQSGVMQICEVIASSQQVAAPWRRHGECHQATTTAHTVTTVVMVLWWWSYGDGHMVMVL